MAEGYRVTITSDRFWSENEGCSTFSDNEQVETSKSVAEGEVHWDPDHYSDADIPYAGTGQVTISGTYQQDPCAGGTELDAPCESSWSYTGEAEVFAYVVSGEEAGIDDPDPDQLYMWIEFDGVDPVTVTDEPEECPPGGGEPMEIDASALGDSTPRGVLLPAQGGRTTDTFEQRTDPQMEDLSIVERSTWVVEIEELD